jgi:acetyl esterase/lipase
VGTPSPRAVDRRYGPEREQYGRLRVPASGAPPYPVVVVIHGGFWRSAHGIEHMEPLAEALAAGGYATWSIAYRRVGEAGGGWPGTFLDVGAAIDQLRAVAAAEPIDMARVVTLGFSAGGHLALWAAARQRIPAGSPLRAADPLGVRGAISLAGVCDLGRGHAIRVGAGAVDALMGGSPERVPERYAAGDPAALLPVGVPQVLIHGTVDGNVPLELSRSYADKAAAAGDDVRLVTLAGAGHFDLVEPSGRPWDALREALGSLV